MHPPTFEETLAAEARTRGMLWCLQQMVVLANIGEELRQADQRQRTPPPAKPPAREIRPKPD